MANKACKGYPNKETSSNSNRDLLGVIKNTLKKRDNIFISGFGTFSIVKRKARKGRNPKTGESVKIAAKFTPKFKRARAFKEMVK